MKKATTEKGSALSLKRTVLRPLTTNELAIVSGGSGMTSTSDPTHTCPPASNTHCVHS